MAVTLCLSCSLGLLNWRSRGHSAGWWLSLRHLISIFYGSQLIRAQRPLRPDVAFPTTSCVQLNSSALCSIFRPYITFKLPRGDMDTPPRLRNFFWYLAIAMCRFRYLWNCLCDRHQAEITVMQFTGHSLPVRQSMSVPWEFFTSSHFMNQFPPTQFPLITAIGMCHFLPGHHLEWHFGPSQKVKIQHYSDSS